MRNEPCWCGSGRKQKKCHKDVLKGSAFANLEQFYNEMGEKVSVNIGCLPCQKGCAQCCYDHFSITSTEWYYIMSKLYEKYSDSMVEEIIDRGYQLWVELQEKDPKTAELLQKDLTSKKPIERSDTAVHQSVFKTLIDSMAGSTHLNHHPCMFLDKETQSCTIYDIRPTICRKFGVSYTDVGEERRLEGCDIILEGAEKYMDEMVDLTEFDEADRGLQQIYLSKYDTIVQDRTYPFFYFCKIHKRDPKLTKLKILELQRHSLEDVFNFKVSRLKPMGL